MPRPGRAAAAGAAAAGAAAAAIAWRALWQEPRSDRVRERDLVLPGWPDELAGLRVALLSDLHAGAPHVREKRIERLVAAVNAHRPDLVLLLGDYIDPEVPFGGPVAPGTVAALLGNHDWHNDGPGMRTALREAGIAVLENEATDAGGLWIAGVEDLRYRRPDIRRALRDVPAGAPVILLAHDPDLFPGVPAH